MLVKYMDKKKIKDALKICSIQNDFGCQCCPYIEERKIYGHEWCTTKLAQDVLAFINEQEDALEQMRLDNQDLRECYAEVLKEITKQG